jgi:membrane fusion protein, multidrug efflux system
MYEDGDTRDLTSASPSPGGRRSLVFWLMVLVGVVLLGGFVFRIGQGLVERLRPPPDLEIPPTLVAAIELQPRPFEFTVPIAGTLAPVHSVDVFPKVGGKVVAVYAGLGDRVTQGDALASVESTEYQIQARQADVGLAMADQAVEVAERGFDRLSTVRERSESFGISEQTFETAQIEVEGTRTQAEQARLQRQLAHKMVDNATMRAPVTGVISKVNALLGSMVGNEYPAFHIDDTSWLVVRCEVGDLDLPQLAAGQLVRLWTDTMPDVVLDGTVTAVAPTLDAWTRRAPVEIEVPNPDGLVTGNLFARGEIVVSEDPAALVLPLEVVQRNVDSAWVQVAAEGVVRKRPVRIVGESRERLAISGLEPGTLVIIPGAEHLAEGEPVEVVVSDPDGEGALADVAQ